MTAKRFHPTRGRPRTWIWPLALAVAARAALGDPISAQESTAKEHSPSTAWELRPYQIRVVIAMEPSPSSPRLEEELRAYLPARATAVVGGAWRLETSAASAELRSQLLSEPTSLKVDGLDEPALSADKVIVLVVRRPRDVEQIYARELDTASGLWNSPVVVDVPQAEALPHAVFQAMLAAFAPLARIEAVEKEGATLRLRAGAIQRRDPALARLADGVVFRPVLILANKSDMPAGPTSVPWTFLVPTETSGSVVKCQLVTGLAGTVIPDFHPLRQRLAVGVSPAQRPTRVKLVSEASGDVALEGYEVVTDQGVKASAAGPQSAMLGRSNREGIVVVPPNPQTLRMLLVRQNNQLLARLPLLPGLDDEVVVPLPDVRSGLAIAAAIEEISDAALDLVARREVLAVRIKAAESGGQSDLTQRLKEQLQKLPSADSLATRLATQQQALQSADKATQLRLQSRLSEVHKLIEKLKDSSAALPVAK